MCAKAAALVQPHDYLVSLSLVIPATRKGECVCVCGGGGGSSRRKARNFSAPMLSFRLSVIGCEEGEHKDVTMKEATEKRSERREGASFSYGNISLQFTR